MARRRLGRGLDGLLPAAPPPSERSTKNNAAIEDLHPGRMQPRVRMDAEALAELAASIREHGHALKDIRTPSRFSYAAKSIFCLFMCVFSLSLFLCGSLRIQRERARGN